MRLGVEVRVELVPVEVKSVHWRNTGRPRQGDGKSICQAARDGASFKFSTYTLDAKGPLLICNSQDTQLSCGEEIQTQQGVERDGIQKVKTGRAVDNSSSLSGMLAESLHQPLYPASGRSLDKLTSPRENSWHLISGIPWGRDLPPTGFQWGLHHSLELLHLD